MKKTLTVSWRTTPELKASLLALWPDDPDISASTALTRLVEERLSGKASVSSKECTDRLLHRMRPRAAALYNKLRDLSGLSEDILIESILLALSYQLNSAPGVRSNFVFAMKRVWKIHAQR